MSQYHKLYTPEDSAVVFIDHQPQMTFGVASIDRASLINNVTLLAKVAKEFGVPAVLTAVETESFSGYVWPHLLDVFPGQPVVERSSMNSWDDPGFRAAIEATGRKNILMTGLWTEVCVTMPALQAQGEGYDVYVVTDASGGVSAEAHAMAVQRMMQAGIKPITWLAVLCEWQRDWANKDTYDAVMDIVKSHYGAYGIGVEYAYTMVHGAPETQFPEYRPLVAAAAGAHK